jgi:hypothetical protein
VRRCNAAGVPHDFALEDPVRLLHGGQLEFRLQRQVDDQGAVGHVDLAVELPHAERICHIDQGTQCPRCRPVTEVLACKWSNYLA